MQYHFLNSSFNDRDGRLEGESGQIVSLRPQVARLLKVLLDQPGQVLDRERLCRSIWDEGTVIDFESGLAAVLRELRRALGEIGLPAELIETIPRRGYRLKLAAQDIRTDPVDVTASASNSARPGLLWPGLTAVVFLILAGGGLLWWIWSPEAPPPDSHDALAILPFEQLADQSLRPEHAGLLMADYLLAELWQEGLPEVALIGRAGLRAYAGREDVAAAVAADLGVNLLIEGSISRVGESWRVDVRLLEIPPGRVRWSGMQLWPAEQPLPVAESAGQLAAQLRENWQQP